MIVFVGSFPLNNVGSFFFILALDIKDQLGFHILDLISVVSSIEDQFKSLVEAFVYGVLNDFNSRF